MRWFVFAPVILLGCSKPAVVAPAQPSAAAVTVTTVTPKAKDIAFSVEQPGTVVAFEFTPLVAKLPGYVSKIHVDMGDRVKAGQPLAEIAIPELVKEAEQKKAATEAAAAEVLQAKANVDVAKAQEASAASLVTEATAAIARVQADYTRWELELKRVESLVANKVIDSQTLDETQKQFRSAAASRDEMIAKHASAEQAVKEAKAKSARAAADVTAFEAKAKLAAADAQRVAALVNYTTIVAPYDGLVTARMVNTGSYLQTSADPLFNVAKLDVVRVFVDVPEQAVNAATVGAAVTVKVGPREVNGTITRTAGVLNPDTRTLRTEIDLPNPDGTLRPGSYAVVKLGGKVANAMTVPAAAVLFADETAYLFEVIDGKALKRRVQPGRRDGEMIHIVGVKTATDWKPLSGTEVIVVGNLGALADGVPVTISP